MMSMRGNNIHFARATVFHELIPGHHLQGYMAARLQDLPPAVQHAVLVEGWALYWELLLWDKGFAKSPENRVGMLFWRMHRCARIIFSLSFHLEKMTPKDASTSWSTGSATSATTPRPRSGARSPARTARSTRRPTCSAACSSGRSIASWWSRAR